MKVRQLQMEEPLKDEADQEVLILKIELLPLIRFLQKICYQEKKLLNKIYKHHCSTKWLSKLRSLTKKLNKNVLEIKKSILTDLKRHGFLVLLNRICQEGACPDRQYQRILSMAKIIKGDFL